MKRMSKKGFTIVELVIVIAVIAVLSAILIPTFSGVISNAKDTAAVSGANNAHTQYLSQQTDGGEVAANFIFDSGDRIVVLKDGKVVADAEGNTLFFESVDAALEGEFNVEDDPATTEVDETKTYTTEESGVEGLKIVKE